jgi:hypothetical protein
MSTLPSSTYPRVVSADLSHNSSKSDHSSTRKEIAEKLNLSWRRNATAVYFFESLLCKECNSRMLNVSISSGKGLRPIDLLAMKEAHTARIQAAWR